jgi:hypothetical protein
MMGILSWVVSNPLMILAALGIWLATGWISDVKSWVSQRSQATQYISVIAKRDQIAEAKDQQLQEALAGRDNAMLEIQKLQADLDAAEIARKTAGTPDCVWSDSDARLLNAAKTK